MGRRLLCRVPAVCLLLSLLLSLTGCGLFAEREMTRRIEDYPARFGAQGSHREDALVRSDIFPVSLPDSAQTEDFLYCYYNPWDPCYANELVYTCDSADYEAEVARLTGLDRDEWEGVYGITGFSQELLAFHGNVYGVVYAMGDEAAHRLTYVEITFCNYFTDIDYQWLIDSDVLPYGFDASHGNPVQQAFLDGSDMHEYFDLLNPY